MFRCPVVRANVLRNRLLRGDVVRTRLPPRSSSTSHFPYCSIQRACRCYLLYAAVPCRASRLRAALHLAARHCADRGPAAPSRRSRRPLLPDVSGLTARTAGVDNGPAGRPDGGAGAGLVIFFRASGSRSRPCSASLTALAGGEESGLTLAVDHRGRDAGELSRALAHGAPLGPGRAVPAGHGCLAGGGDAEHSGGPAGVDERRAGEP